MIGLQLSHNLLPVLLVVVDSIVAHKVQIAQYPFVVVATRVLHLDGIVRQIHPHQIVCSGRIVLELERERYYPFEAFKQPISFKIRLKERLFILFDCGRLGEQEILLLQVVDYFIAHNLPSHINDWIALLSYPIGHYAGHVELVSHSL